MDSMAQALDGHLRDTRHSETLLNNQLARQRLESEMPLYRFGFGESPFPVPDRVISAMHKATHRKEYSDVQGLLELREAITTFHNSLEGHKWKPDELLIGPGSKILLFCLMAALRDADVLLPAPSWVSYEPQAHLAGHRVLQLPTRPEHGWQLTPQSLQEHCSSREPTTRPQILVLNYPGNPTGQSYSENDLEAFAAVMRQHRILVISDEIYGLLNHKGEHRSLAHHYPEGTIITTGLSKWCGAGGWRLGAVRIPPQLGRDYLQRVIGVASETYSSASTPVQLAAVTAYQHCPDILEYVCAQRNILSTIGNRLAAQLSSAGVRVAQPQGGFYLFPDFSPLAPRLARRGIHTCQQLTGKLLQDTGVSLLAGSAFGMDGARLTARLAYVDFDGADALRAGRANTQRMDDGIERLGDWLQDM